jgi:Protein of unknown function (DUF3096)
MMALRRIWRNLVFRKAGDSPSPSTEAATMVTVAHIQPLVALLAGVLILLIPRLLNYIVAIYLIVVGITGLGLIR